MFQRPLKRRALLALVPALVLSATGIVYAGDNVLHGPVLSVQPQNKTFRMRVLELNKERTIFTTAQTVFRFPNGHAAAFSDVKVGKTVEIKATVKSADAYTASVVTIRL